MNLQQLQRTIDRFNETREQRLAADRESRTLKEVESQLEQEIIEAMREHTLTRVENVKLQTKEKPVAQDWNEVYAYIRDNDAFELLQRRLHEGAIEERREHGDNLPGIGFIEVHKLSVSKR